MFFKLMLLLVTFKNYKITGQMCLILEMLSCVILSFFLTVWSFIIMSVNELISVNINFFLKNLVLTPLFINTYLYRHPNVNRIFAWKWRRWKLFWFRIFMVLVVIWSSKTKKATSWTNITPPPLILIFWRFFV